MNMAGSQIDAAALVAARENRAHASTPLDMQRAESLRMEQRRLELAAAEQAAAEALEREAAAAAAQARNEADDNGARAKLRHDAHERELREEKEALRREMAAND